VLNRRQFFGSLAGAGAWAACPHRLLAADRARQGPLLSFGLVADIQYRDAERRGRRFFRDSLAKLRECVERFNRLRPDFVVQLGDLIDGGFASFDPILAVYRVLTPPGYHVLGNHDVNVEPQNLGKVLAKLGLDGLGSGRGYYDFQHTGWRFVVLNGNERAAPSPPPPHTAQGLVGSVEEQLAGKARAWHGAMGAGQLAWLDKTLAQAAAAAEPVIVFSHFPACGPGPLSIWNHAELLRVLEARPGVAAHFSGHLHENDYSRRKGIHYLTLCGMVETQETAYALIEVYPDSLRLYGFGREPSRVLSLALDRRKLLTAPAG
jgi:3',5'-cyclic AMP phosphodiesterase CpdA